MKLFFRPKLYITRDSEEWSTERLFVRLGCGTLREMRLWVKVKRLLGPIWVSYGEDFWDWPTLFRMLEDGDIS